MSNRREIMLTASHQYLTQRRQTYYYRRRIPRLLQPLFDGVEFIVSLQTPHFQDAKRLATRYDNWFDQLICQEIIKNMQTPDPRKIIGFSIKTDKEGNKAIDFPVEEIIALRAAGFTAEEINSLIQTAQSSNPQTIRIGENLQLLNHAAECSSEKLDPTPEARLLLSEAINGFNASLIQKKSTSGWLPPPNQHTFFRRLTEITGDKPINDISRSDANRVLNQIKLLPANTAKYRNSTVTEILESQVTTGVEKPPLLSAKSINSHMELYTRLFDWAINEEHTKNNNPFNALRIEKNKKAKAKDARLAFTRTDIATIFSTPLYTQGQYEHPFQFWIPLVALFTGARRAEIAALYITDIYRDNAGIYVFDFNENTEDKRLKTANSIRKTPVHPFLESLGLHDFIDDCRKANKKRLFEELNWTEKEGYGRVVGDWFNGSYLKQLQIHQNRKKVFYSFRHTFATELKKRQVDISSIEQLSGREIAPQKSVGQTTYIDDEETTVLLQSLLKLDFSDELKNVRWISKSILG
jgi:integrase